MNITPNSLKISQLLGSQNEQYVIPAYQRRYSWKQQQIDDLWADISLLEATDSHLLGTIVCLTGHHTAGINQLELVDGQQRLTTISILLYCLLDRLVREKETAEAQDLERLLKAKPLGGTPQPKILLDSMDADQFSKHASGVDIEQIQNPRLAEAFKFFHEKIGDCTIEQVGAILYKLKDQAVIIRLDVSEAKDAFKLFETINNRGLRLSPTDIIKNFVLGNAARFGAEHLNFAKDKWSALVRNLDGLSSEAFFRQYMIATLKRRVTKSLVVEEFQSAFMKEVREAEKLPDRGWYCSLHGDTEEDDDESEPLAEEDASTEEESNADQPGATKISFTEFLGRLISYSKTYREIANGQTGNPKLDRRLRNLRLIKSLPSHGFLMTLRAGGCSPEHFEQILRWIESFLLRRHICRERTNDNETVFAKLCAVDPKNPLESVRQTLHEYCPSDEKFCDEFATATFPASLIERARYCLEQFELRQQGKFLELIPGGADAVHVEHIMPQKIKTKKAKNQFGDWPAYLGPGAEGRHTRYVSVIGNLTLFSGELNISASNNPYERKKAAYSASAMKLTNSLPSEYPEFRFEQIKARSKALAALAVEIWPAI